MKIQHAGLLVLMLFSVAGCGSSATTTTTPPPACMSTSATLVCTQSGEVQGTIEGQLRAFRGIPYAAPPVGNLRWRPPAAPPSWQGIRDATMFGNVCPQTDYNGGVRGKEDCLTLNVFTANPPPNVRQPVMVFFHGGGQKVGDVQSVPYNPAPPLASHGVIVVTVEYRIGLLGFLSNPLLTAEGGGSSGNYSLMDMIAALKWVRDNIAGFGGDPSKVMMFGQSAGSANVQVLLVAPPAQGLFARAGMESGVTPSGQLAGGLPAAYPLYAPLAPLVHCDTSPDILACLRAVPADTIVQTQLLPGQFPIIGFNIEPIVIPVDPFDKLRQQGSPVPLLIGSNRDEAADQEDPSLALDANGYATLIHTEFDPMLAGSGDQILSVYPATFDTTPRYTHIDVETDYNYTCETRNLARAVAGAHRPAVWRYLFTHRYENNTFVNSLRAFHTAELDFVFGNIQQVYYTGVPYTPSAAEVSLSNELMDYWARFAATGDPNGAGATPWLVYDAANENILQLDETFSNIAGYRNLQCDVLSTLPQP
jgi:para-nitrobenzyl esterase